VTFWNATTTHVGAATDKPLSGGPESLVHEFIYLANARPVMPRDPRLGCKPCRTFEGMLEDWTVLQQIKQRSLNRTTYTSTPRPSSSPTNTHKKSMFSLRLSINPITMLLAPIACLFAFIPCTSPAREPRFAFLLCSLVFRTQIEKSLPSYRRLHCGSFAVGCRPREDPSRMLLQTPTMLPGESKPETASRD
jgi:hypothetical protein